MGSASGGVIPSSSWKTLRKSLESWKSSSEEARCGWVAHLREAAKALCGSGIDLVSFAFRRVFYADSSATHRKSSSAFSPDRPP